MEIGRVDRRVVEAVLDGGDIAADGGVVLLRLVDPAGVIQYVTRRSRL